MVGRQPAPCNQISIRCARSATTSTSASRLSCVTAPVSVTCGTALSTAGRRSSKREKSGHFDPFGGSAPWSGEMTTRTRNSFEATPWRSALGSSEPSAHARSRSSSCFCVGPEAAFTTAGSVAARASMAASRPSVVATSNGKRSGLTTLRAQQL
eukprot:3687696-Prymnesium_polylepis.1